jgi:hypothetical protein
VSRDSVTAEPRADDPRAGPERNRSPGARRASIWVLNGVLVAVAAIVYIVAIAPLRQSGDPMLVPVLIFIAAFAAGEWWRVFIHFRSQTQSFSLSELPLVIGVFMLTPDHLVLARVVGTAIALGVLRRQDPIKLLFNLASFALETETVAVLVHRVSGTNGNSRWSGSGCSSSWRLPRCSASD